MKNAVESSDQTRKEAVINTITIEPTKTGCLVIEMPVTFLPNSLRSGKIIAEEIKALCEKTTRERLVNKLERFLQRAYIAEGKKDYFRAGRAFALALFCEGRLKNDVKANAYTYVLSAMPVY